jgi:Zn-dependent protease/predicted transcriptional regulator
MEAQIRLGRIFGVEIGLHYSWLIIAFLITLSLASHFRMTNAQWGSGVIWASAIVTGVLFFVAIIAHELSHAAVAKAYGLPVKSITLFALGGVAQIEKEAGNAKTEFWMGIAGPIASAVIGFILLGIAFVLGWAPTYATPMSTPDTPLLAMLVWLGYINFSLAVFNLIPGFPLDGGRVLRAVIWWITGKADRSTQIAARVGQLVAFGFIGLGLIRFFGGAGFGGLWIAFIGWFLLDAARASYLQVGIAEGLRGLRVGDVMDSDCPTVDGRSNLQTLADDYLLRTGRRCFLVVENGRVAGLITPHEIKQVERARWPYTTVDAVMRPLEQLRTIAPDAPVVAALEAMGRDDLNQLPVVSDGQLKGTISRGHILQLLQTRAELNL